MRANSAICIFHRPVRSPDIKLPLGLPSWYADGANSELMDNLNIQSRNSDVDGCPFRLQPENNPHEALPYLSSKTEFLEVKKIKPFLSLSPPTPRGKPSSQYFKRALACPYVCARPSGCKLNASIAFVRSQGPRNRKTKLCD